MLGLLQTGPEAYIGHPGIDSLQVRALLSGTVLR